MSDGWLRRTKDGTLWRVENPDAYAAVLKEGGFVACEPPVITPVYPTEPVLTPEQQQARDAHLTQAEQQYARDGWTAGRAPVPLHLRGERKTTTTDGTDEESTDTGETPA
jgi:hypothetical protein